MRLSKADKWGLVRGTNLKPEDRHCLLVLFLFQGDNGTAFCRQETLADEIGVHPRSVRRSLQRLNDTGVLVSSWQILNGVPMRTYSIDFEKLRAVQRTDGRTPASYRETPVGRTPASGSVGHQRPNHQDTSVLQEHPINIQGTSTSGNSGNSRASSGKAAGKTPDAKLIAFCVEWNAWHSAGIVRQKIRDTSDPGKTIRDAWKRGQRDREQRERLSDLPGLRAAIEAGRHFLDSAAWFDAAGLVGGRNANRRWYAEQLVAGAYRDKLNGSAFPAADPAAESAWAAVLEAIRRHSRYSPDAVRGELDERAWAAAKSIGLRKLDESNEHERRELRLRFIAEFSKREGAAA